MVPALRGRGLIAVVECRFHWRWVRWAGVGWDGGYGGRLGCWGWKEVAREREGGGDSEITIGHVGMAERTGRKVTGKLV